MKTNSTLLIAVMWGVAFPLAMSSHVSTVWSDDGVETPFQSVEIGNLHNGFRIGQNLYSGSGPESEEDYEALRDLGVRTIVSVDGAVPNVEMARKLGMRYVHIPLKYSDVSGSNTRQLASVFTQCEKPIYVHCHHGKHRGPTAAAIIARQAGLLSQQQAVQFLKHAGTGANYEGLWQCVRQYEPLPKLDDFNLPEMVSPEALQKSMVQMADHFHTLQVLLKQDDDQLDSKTFQEAATLLLEDFRESARLADVQEEIQALLSDAASELELLLKDHSVPQQRLRMQLIGSRCVDCHQQHRG
ncbi:MAG: tyrosine-protein phosphatase [Planctomycetaceae bacterium]|nr:tyrosine-protein phosphatase [Planctomycetaceae bacterium]